VRAALLGAVSVLLGVASAGAGAQPPDALSRLKRDGHVACEPSVPYFCANLHVSCAGRTAVPTFAFSLRATPAGAALDAGPHARAFVEQYAGGSVQWSSDGRYVIVRPARTGGYIKLFRDGRYVFRHYPQHEGIMSLGSCA
jgi:hypothetical protein